MRHSLRVMIVLSLLAVAAQPRAAQGDRAAIIQTNEQIRKGFVEQDIAYILAFHHPDVEKVFSWHDHQIGHGDMRTALSATFANYRLSFAGEASDMLSLDINGDTAVMLANFTIEGQPKDDDLQPFTFSGRTMIVYVRYAPSPTGWATLREMIVPQS